MAMTKTFSARELADECDREITQRRRVYARLVEQGKMRKASADTQIAMMIQIRDRYDKEAKEDALEGRLL